MSRPIINVPYAGVCESCKVLVQITLNDCKNPDDLRGSFVLPGGCLNCGDTLPGVHLRRVREVCILNCDSPSYPPELQEYRQCWCAQCVDHVHNHG